MFFYSKKSNLIFYLTSNYSIILFMLLCLFLKNLLMLFYNFYIILQLIKTKSIKNFLLFMSFYIFLNLYLLPTFALCEIDLDLLDREKNTYKGSKIYLETPDEIVTHRDMIYSDKVCKMIIILSLYAMTYIFLEYIFS